MVIVDVVAIWSVTAVPHYALLVVVGDTLLEIARHLIHNYAHLYSGTIERDIGRFDRENQEIEIRERGIKEIEIREIEIEIRGREIIEIEMREIGIGINEIVI